MDAVLELIWQGSYGSTTIDHICEKAGVKKGSFYYFFESKSDLAAAALEAEWLRRKPQLDAIFSPTVSPLDRIRKFCEGGYRMQAELQKTCGCVLGCPLFTLGSEVCHQDEVLLSKIREVLMNHQQYIESAIRDADAMGIIRAPDAAVKARTVFAYCQGLMTHARILNDPEILKEMYPGVMMVLGQKANVKRAAA
jgi:TetR/AcrR family transcriptional regulator, transcriptional repressor for nem operon